MLLKVYGICITILTDKFKRNRNKVQTHAKLKLEHDKNILICMHDTHKVNPDSVKPYELVSCQN